MAPIKVKINNLGWGDMAQRIRGKEKRMSHINKIRIQVIKRKILLRVRWKKLEYTQECGVRPLWPLTNGLCANLHI